MATLRNRVKGASQAPAKSDALDSVHEMMGDLHNIGLVSRETMRSFEAGCLAPLTEFAPGDIVALREKAQMSQPVFARHLGLTRSTIAKWETGEKRPSGPSRRLLEIVAKHGIAILA